MGTETELKLHLSRTALSALRRHPVLAAALRDGNARTLDNTYYDTPGLALRKNGIALRTRRHGRRWWQTVKRAAPATGGLSARPEWEQPYSDTFDFSAIDDAAARKLLLRHQHNLAPLFSTRFRRETWAYSPDPDTRILIMIDTGEVLCGEHRDPICEIELELAAGNPVDLLLLARQLAADLPLVPDDTSKAARGYRLFLELPLAPARAEPSGLSADLSPVEAFRLLAAACVRQWQANVGGAATSHDPEFIHQLRVAQRRLRSLIRLFAPALPETFVAHWVRLLRDNAGRLGDARDLDVLEDAILAPVTGATEAERAALARLRAVFHDLRSASRQNAIDSLDTACQGRLLLDFTIALHQLPTNNLIGAADLATFAGLQLDEVRRKVRKRARAAREQEPATLHALRLTLKQLRYGMEFFAPLMPEKNARRQLRSLSRAQDALGFVHDMDVAREHLARRAGGDPALLAASAFVCGWHGPRYHKLCRRALADLAPLVDGPAPWRE